MMFEPDECEKWISDPLFLYQVNGDNELYHGLLMD